MKNFDQPGHSLPLPMPYDRASGHAVERRHAHANLMTKTENAA
jgi:hypothetical protein